MRFRIEIRCPTCGAVFDPRAASPYGIRTGPDGEDVVTFTCPRCGAGQQESTVRRV